MRIIIRISGSLLAGSIKLTPFTLCLDNMTLCPLVKVTAYVARGLNERATIIVDMWGSGGYKKPAEAGFTIPGTLQQLLLFSLNDQPARVCHRRVVACAEATLQNASVTTGARETRGPSSLNSFATISLSREYGRCRTTISNAIGLGKSNQRLNYATQLLRRAGSSYDDFDEQ